MPRFILGFDQSNPDVLKEYSSEEEADFNSEDWCTVDAPTLEEAKDDYENQFAAHKKAGRINGCM